tara:strand:+ start:706 stop:2550 length:1845 start_codon:yes stop_codon:yes gene_type:complete
MKIWEKINNITGNDSKSRYLVPYINAGSKFLLSALPEKFLWTIASESEINGFSETGVSEIGVGSSIAYDKVLAVYRFDSGKKRICSEAPDNSIHIFDEASSLLRATKMFPKFYKLSGKIYIKPDPDYNNQTGNNDESYTELGASSATTVSAGAGDKGVIVYSAPPVVDENTDSWILAEYENIVLFYAASLDHFRLAATYRDLCKKQVDIVANGTLSLNTSAVLPSSMSLTRSLPTITYTDSLPVPINITASLPSSFNLTKSLPTLDPISTSLPSGFSISSSLPSDFSSAISLPSEFSSPTDVIKPSELIFNLDADAISDALTKAESFVDGTSTANNAQELLDDEDAEMVNALVNVANLELGRAGASINKEKNKLDVFTSKFGQKMNTYQNDISKYSAEVQKEANRIKSELDKCNASVSKEDSRIKSQISKYSSEVQKESGRISSELAKYEREVSRVVSKYQADVAGFSAEVQKEASRTNSDISVYNAELTKEKTRVETEIAKWQANLSKVVQIFNADLQAYQTEFQKEGQRLSSGIARYESDLNKASRDMEKQIQQFSLDMQAAQVYTSKSSQSIQTSGMYYQRAINELGAITGSAVAPEQQQVSQRKEQGATS